jgi:hypothetical protein
MQEGFNEDEGGDAESKFELGVDFSEEPTPVPEKIKRGILTRINQLAWKYPKTYRLGMSLIFSLELGALSDQVHKRIEDRIRIDLPGIQGPARANKPSASRQFVLDGIYNETGEYDRIRAAVSIENEDERAEVVELPSVTRVEGFEEFSISNEIVRGIIEETLPKGFLRNVRAIRYRDTRRKMPLDYGENLGTSAIEAGHAIDRTRAIEITEGAKKSSKRWIAHNLIPHEVFHLEDANSNSLLTIDERIDLHRILIDRVKSPDRFKSAYVEAIKNTDKKLELKLKVGEYFAEIGATYLSPEYFLLPEEDKELIRSFIAKIDPTFDRVKALNIRRDLMGDNVVEVKVKSLDELIKEEVQSVLSIEDSIKAFKQGFQKANGGKGVPLPSEDILKVMARNWYAEDLERAISNAKIRHKDLLKQHEEAQKVYRGEK